ncbi:MAG: 4Fe-4S dicluster domain-containing protein [Acidobacteriaceae bacterium]
MVDFIDRGMSVATQPTVCMHCEDPVAPCAQVCPVLAIQITPEGVVQQADPSRCIACRNCVYACPFGVPKIDLEARLMKKCNLCYDRTSQDLQPWCAQACPTDALWYGTHEQFANERSGRAVRHTEFGTQEVRTRVYHVVPSENSELRVFVDADGVSRTGEGEQGDQLWVL